MTAGPPLWLVGGVVHLFGVTAGARGDAWLTAEVRQALGSSDELWVETPPSVDVEGNPLLQELGVCREGQRLSPAVAERVEQVLADLGMPPASLSMLRPWVMVQILDRMRLDAAKIDEGINVEHVLVTLAQEAGIPVRSEWPAVDDALRFLGGLPDEVQEEYLLLTLDNVEGGDDDVDREFSAWRFADLDALARRFEAVAGRYPAFYDTLVRARNGAWVPRIRAAVDAGRRSFVAPGMGHLAGPGNLVDLLTADGLPAVRV